MSQLDTLDDLGDTGPFSIVLVNICWTLVDGFLGCQFLLRLLELHPLLDTGIAHALRTFRSKPLVLQYRARN